MRFLFFIRDSLLMKIFELLDATTTQMTNNNPELLTFDVRTDSLVNLAGPTTSRKSLNLRKNLHKTVLFYKLLEHIAELLINDKTDNIRSFYYTLKDSAIAPVTVSEIDICIQEIASLFSCRTWDLSNYLYFLQNIFIKKRGKKLITYFFIFRNRWRDERRCCWTSGHKNAEWRDD